MNIGIDISSLFAKERTGVGEYTFQFLNAIFIQDKKNQYFLFSNQWKEAQEHFWEQKNVHWVQTRYPNKIFHTLLFLLRRPFIDELIVQESEKKGMFPGHLDVFFSPNISFFRVSKKCFHIQMIHDLSFELFPEFFSKKMRWWHRFLQPKKKCENAQAIFVPSENTKRDVRDIYRINEEKIHVFYPGVSQNFISNTFDDTVEKQNQIRQKYGLPEKFFLFLGSLEPRKNILGLISAYKKSHTSKDHGLVIAGPKGWKYKNIIQTIANSTGVQYIGYVDELDKPYVYGLAHVFVYPSFYEGFGIPVLEALYRSVPVITSNGSSLPEITNGTSVLIDPHQPGDITKALDQLTGDEKMVYVLKNNAEEQARIFDWKKSAEQFLHFLHDHV